MALYTRMSFPSPTPLPPDNIKAEDIHLCPDCDLPLKFRGTRSEQKGKGLCCPRCRHLFRTSSGSLENCRALTLTGLILYFPANLEPILQVTMGGQQESNTIFSGVLSLWHEQLYPVAGAVALSALVIPLLRLMVLGLILLPKGFVSQSFGCWFMRIHHASHGWGMVDIFFLASLVAVIKIRDFAEVVPGAGLGCLAGMILAEMLASRLLPRKNMWSRFGYA